MKTVRVGSRESVLAVKQAMIVMNAIEAYDPAIRTQLVTMKTTGDKKLDKPIPEIGGKGVFVKELEQALLAGEVDICVHSLKDMSTTLNPAIPLVATGEREDPRDVLVLPAGAKKLDSMKPVGCSSLRRRTQVQRIYPVCRVEPVRGNILTRLEKLDGGQYSALILAAAGLIRLGLENRISRSFGKDEMIPACGQGVLGVQGRAGEDYSYLKLFHNGDAWDTSLAERAFIDTLEGGCTSPVTAYAWVEGETLTIMGYSVDGKGNSYPGTLSGNRGDAVAIGRTLAQRLKQEAARG